MQCLHCILKCGPIKQELHPSGGRKNGVRQTCPCNAHSQVARQKQAALVGRGQGAVQVVALGRPPLLASTFLCRARSSDMTEAFGTHGVHTGACQRVLASENRGSQRRT